MNFDNEHISHILFIPEIFIEDCIDYHDDDLIVNNIDLAIEPEDIDLIESADEKTQQNGLELNDLLNKAEVTYDIVPKFFINHKKWISNTNLLCSYCHDNINHTPFPIAIGLHKILIPDGDDDNLYVSLLSGMKSDKLIDKINDDHLLYSCQTNKEVKAYTIHNILFCDISCAGNYIRKVQDNKIINTRESLQMTIAIYQEITGELIDDIPEKDLWIVMKQYCGETGQTQTNYRKKNMNKEINLKLAMKISY